MSFGEDSESKMSLTTGNQLRAGRALLNMSQERLAEISGIGINTIRNMEARGAEDLVSRFANVLSVQRVLEARGVRFLAESRQGGVGVRLVPARRPSSAAAIGDLP